MHVAYDGMVPTARSVLAEERVGDDRRCRILCA